ncbi:MAG: hypothetical protein JF603_08565 [Acidobacteria bacterium]|nr:hypothetical protein [Acidobacteriota bacterium]
MAVTRGDPPELLIADSDAVLGRVLALQLVAKTAPEAFGSPGALDEVRQALLDERWADAVVAWMDATGEVVDAYPDETVWSERLVDEEYASVEIRLAPIFDERP